MSDRVRKKMDDVLGSLTEIVIGGNLWDRDGMWEKGKCVAIYFCARIWNVAPNTSVVFRGRANRPSVFAMVCPGCAIGGLGVYNNVSTRRGERTCIKIKVTEDVSERGEFRIGSGVAKKIQGEYCLRQKSVPFTKRKVRIAGGKASKKVVFEGLNSAFGCVASVDMRRDELEIYFLFAQSLTKILRDFVIKNVSVRLNTGERQG